MSNDELSQQKIGYGILAELRSVTETLSQSKRLQPIIPLVQDYIDSYAAYLD